MRAFLLPKSIRNKIDTTTRNFFWGHDASSRKLHTVNQENIAKPKKYVGLGIRSACHQNKIQILKHIQYFNTNPDNLWTTIMKSKYGQDILNRRTFKSHSLRNMQKIMPIYSSCTKNIIGDGKKHKTLGRYMVRKQFRMKFIGSLSKIDLEKKLKASLQEPQMVSTGTLMPFPTIYHDPQTGHVIGTGLRMNPS